MNENEAITVTLTLENDEELECAVLSIFEAEERECRELECISGGKTKRRLCRVFYGSELPGDAFHRTGCYRKCYI